ncbi:hypothetical protein FRB96_003765 [Tulasnella sp. 330]|nr:hypothetical protein FRB96_003765 [Tulasnella sp. 330]
MRHPGHIHDLGAVIASVQQQFPGAPIYLLGASLGAALVQNYLAEMGDEAPVSGAMVLSPVEMHAMFNKNQRVFSTEHAEAVSAVTSPASSRQATPISTPLSTPNSSPMSTPPPSLASYSSSEDIQPFVMLENVQTLARSGKLSLTEFSDKIIAPTAGYETAEEFVNVTSSAHDLHKIKVPMLHLSTNDDPLLGGDDLPRDQASLSEHVAMVFRRGKDGKGLEFKRWSSRVAVEFFEELSKLQLLPPPQLRIVEGKGILKGYLHPEGRPMQAFMKISTLFTRIVITPPDKLV